MNEFELDQRSRTNARHYGPLESRYDRSSSRPAMTVWAANPSRHAVRRDLRLLLWRSPLGRSAGSASSDSTGHKCIIADP